MTSSKPEARQRCRPPSRFQRLQNTPCWASGGELARKMFASHIIGRRESCPARATRVRTAGLKKQHLSQAPLPGLCAPLRCSRFFARAKVHGLLVSPPCLIPLFCTLPHTISILLHLSEAVTLALAPSSSSYSVSTLAFRHDCAHRLQHHRRHAAGLTAVVDAHPCTSLPLSAQPFLSKQSIP